MPEDTPEFEDSSTPAIPLFPDGASMEGSGQPGSTEEYRDVHLGRSFGTPPGPSEPQDPAEAPAAAEGAAAPTPEASGRMRDILARAVGERTEEQRAMVETLAELRQLVPQLHLRMQDTAESLEAQLAALGEHVAEQERATGNAIGERLQGITAELDAQAQLSAALSDALAAIAADLGAIPALHDAVRQLADRPAHPELTALQESVSAQGERALQDLEGIRSVLDQLNAPGQTLSAQLVHDHLERTAVREAAVQEALQGVLASLGEGAEQQRQLLQAAHTQTQGQEGLLEALASVREHLQRPDDTREVLTALSEQVRQQHETLEAVREHLQRPDDTREVLAALSEQVRQQHETLEAVREHLQRPDDTREVLSAVGAQVRQQNDVLLALGEQVQGAGEGSREGEGLAPQLQQQSAAIDALREQLRQQSSMLDEARTREAATHEVLQAVRARLEEPAQPQRAGESSGIDEAQVAELIAASERRVTEHLDQTLYSLVELLVQRRRPRSTLAGSSA